MILGLIFLGDAKHGIDMEWNADIALKTDIS